MADLGYVCTSPPAGVDRLAHYETVFDALPPEFSTIWVADHLQFGDHPRAEAWTLLTYLAATHSRFRFGHLVLSQSFRNPALLAKMTATLQELTGGRYVLGIGAGWHEEEYRAFGYDYPRGGIRVRQLEEAIEIMRAMWTQSPATFHGEHYRIDGAHCAPQPDPPIPILVGTNGPKALRVVARLADMWSWDGPWETVYRKPYEALRQHCEEIGRPFEEIELTANLTISFPEDPTGFEPTYTHDAYPGQVFGITGPGPAEAIAQIEELVDVGVSHLQLVFEDEPTFRRFLDEVVPDVRLEPSAAA